MKVLISSAGSHGDVLPFIAIGRELRARGNEVVLFANPYFRDYVIAAGLQFVPISTVEAYARLFGELAESDPQKALQRVSAHFGEICRDYYQAMKAQILAGQTLTIGNSSLFASRLLQEMDGVPCAAVHLARCLIRSNLKPARLVPDWINAGTPTLSKRAAWWAADKFYFDPYFAKPLNKLRVELGLAPVANVCRYACGHSPPLRVQFGRSADCRLTSEADVETTDPRGRCGTKGTTFPHIFCTSEGSEISGLKLASEN